MTVFSSLEAAQREGFRWSHFNAEYRLHVVEMDRRGKSGMREKAIAFARPSAEEDFR